MRQGFESLNPVGRTEVVGCGSTESSFNCTRYVANNDSMCLKYNVLTAMRLIPIRGSLLKYENSLNSMKEIYIHSTNTQNIPLRYHKFPNANNAL